MPLTTVLTIGGFVMLLFALLKDLRFSAGEAKEVTGTPTGKRARIILFAFGLTSVFIGVVLDTKLYMPLLKVEQPRFTFIDVNLTPDTMTTTEATDMRIATAPRGTLPENTPKTYRLSEFHLAEDARIVGAWCVPAFNVSVAQQYERLVVMHSERSVDLHARLWDDKPGTENGHPLVVRIYILWTRK